LETDDLLPELWPVVTVRVRDVYARVSGRLNQLRYGPVSCAFNQFLWTVAETFSQNRARFEPDEPSDPSPGILDADPT
jgi:hypothetical protein